MPKPTSVVATTRLGAALERHRIACGMTRQSAYRRTGTSNSQWRRLLTEERPFEPWLIKRAAAAVGMDVREALALAKFAVVPNGTKRVLTESEVELLMAS